MTTQTTISPYPDNERILLINADDLGVSPHANGAINELLACGAITSATIMLPAPYAREAVHKTEPEYATGVHLTLTGPFRPISEPSLVRSLIGENGLFPDNPAEVERSAKPEEVHIELRNQIEAALSLGLNPTHADNHQGSVMGLGGGNDFLEITLELCREYGLPFRLPKRITEQPFFPDLVKQMLRGRIESARSKGIVLPDDLISLPYTPQAGEDYNTIKAELMRSIRAVRPGITELVLHPERPVPAIPHPPTHKHFAKRLIEYRLMLDPDIRKLIEDEGICLLSWSHLKQWQTAQDAQAPGGYRSP